MHLKCTNATEPEHLHGLSVISWIVFRYSKQIRHQGSAGGTKVDLRLSSCALPTDTKDCTRFSWLQFINLLQSRRNGIMPLGYRHIEYMKQSPNVVAIRVSLEQNQRFTVQLFLCAFFLALTLAQLLDGSAQQTLAVCLSPFLDKSRTQWHIFTIYDVVAENSNVGFATPSALLLCEDQGKTVYLED